MQILPYDLTGNKSSNRKTEIKTPENPMNKGYVVCPEWGAFYSDSLSIVDSTGKNLTKGIDYNVGYLYEEISLITAKEVMGLILINNTAKPPFTITGQYVGGDLFISAKEMKQAIVDMLNSDLFKFSFWDILNRPTAFVPSKHRHDFWQLLGMGSTVEMLNEINSALMDRFYKPIPVLAGLRQYAQSKITEAESALTPVITKLDNHYVNYSNPHQDTKTKLSLNNVNDWSLATDNEAIDVTCENRYQTAYGLYTLLSQVPSLEQHINAINPHKTTIQELGGLNKAEWLYTFDQYLPLNGVAYNSVRFNGKTVQELYAVVGTNLNATDYTGIVLPTPFTGSGGNLSQVMVLCGDKTYRTLSQMFDNYPVNKNKLINLGYFNTKADFYNALVTKYPNEAPTTVAVGNIKDTYPFNYLKADKVTALDAVSAKVGNTICYVKTSTNWTEL